MAELYDPSVAEKLFSTDGWFKSSFSNGDGSGCVVVNHNDDGYTGVRDSKLGNVSPVLVFNSGEWKAFLKGAANGEFNRP